MKQELRPYVGVVFSISLVASLCSVLACPYQLSMFYYEKWNLPLHGSCVFYPLL